MNPTNRKINNAIRKASGKVVAADDPAEAEVKKQHEAINNAIRRASGRSQ